MVWILRIPSARSGRRSIGKGTRPPPTESEKVIAIEAAASSEDGALNLERHPTERGL
jgi:hypothetical protein